MKYKLIAMDVDGTLVGPDSIVSPETIDAVAAAEQAGFRVCLATGRSYIETMPVWRQLYSVSRLPDTGRRPSICNDGRHSVSGPPVFRPEPMILIGGALVSEPDTGRTLYQRSIPRALAVECSEALAREGYSSSIILDAWRHGLDYIFVEGDDSAKVDAMWFSKMNFLERGATTNDQPVVGSTGAIRIHRVRRLADMPDSPPALRINAVVDPAAGAALAGRLASQFAGRLNVHSIFAPNYGVNIVEAFCASASKWTALVYAAGAMRIAPAEIIAIGDDVNDLSMIRSAGMGVAMPWAKDVVKASAKAVAEPNLAAFIRRLLATAPPPID